MKSSSTTTLHQSRKTPCVFHLILMKQMLMMRNISTPALATLSTWMELHHIPQQATLHSILNLLTFRLFSGPVFDTVWTGPFNESRPIQQTSAFDLFLAGVEERVTCTGPGCHYDPHPAKPKPLTCHVSA